MNNEQSTTFVSQNKPKTNPTCRGVASGEAGSNPISIHHPVNLGKKLMVSTPQYARRDTRYEIQTQSLVKDLNALVNAWMFISKTVKNSCSRCRALLQSFQENFDKPGERKAECSAWPKLRTDPMNLLGIMPAKAALKLV